MIPVSWCWLWSVHFSALLHEANYTLMLTSRLLVACMPCLHSHKTTMFRCSILSESVYSSLPVRPSPTPPFHSWLPLISAFPRYWLHLWHCALCTDEQSPAARTLSAIISLSAFRFILLSLHHITLQKHCFSKIHSHSLSSSPSDIYQHELLHTQKYSFLILGTSSWERWQRINIQCSRGDWLMNCVETRSTEMIIQQISWGHLILHSPVVWQVQLRTEHICFSESITFSCLTALKENIALGKSDSIMWHQKEIGQGFCHLLVKS